VDKGVYKPLLSGISREHLVSDTSLLKNCSQTPLTYEEAGVDRYNHYINTSEKNHSNITTSQPIVIE
jgi:dethiobiotin synthetase